MTTSVALIAICARFVAMSGHARAIVAFASAIQSVRPVPSVSACIVGVFWRLEKSRAEYSPRREAQAFFPLFRSRFRCPEASEERGGGGGGGYQNQCGDEDGRVRH